MYKGYKAILRQQIPWIENPGMFEVTWDFIKDGVTTSYTEHMSKVDPQIARNFIDELAAPEEATKAEEDAQKRIEEQVAYVALLTENPPLGYFELS